MKTIKEILFILLLGFLLVLISCKTVHKITEEHKTKIDSTNVIVKDTTSVIKQNSSTEITNLKDINIKIIYNNDSVINKPDGTVVKSVINPSIKGTKGSNKLNDVINDAISASGNAGKIPSSIEIHIGSIEDSITVHSKIDSTNVKINDSTKIKAEKEDYMKNVSKSGPTVGDYLIIIMISLIAIFLLGAKFLK